MPILIEPAIQIPMGVMSTSDIHCVSMAEDLLRYILMVIVVVVSVFLILIALHRVGSIQYESD
jgi:fumarate reductase subunit D